MQRSTGPIHSASSAWYSHTPIHTGGFAAIYSIFKAFYSKNCTFPGKNAHFTWKTQHFRPKTEHFGQKSEHSIQKTEVFQKKFNIPTKKLKFYFQKVHIFIQKVHIFVKNLSWKSWYFLKKFTLFQAICMFFTWNFTHYTCSITQKMWPTSRSFAKLTVLSRKILHIDLKQKYKLFEFLLSLQLYLKLFLSPNKNWCYLLFLVRAPLTVITAHIVRSTTYN